MDKARAYVEHWDEAYRNNTGLLAIGKSSAYALVRSGQIRSIRIGKKYRIPREAVTEFISKCL